MSMDFVGLGILYATMTPCQLKLGRLIIFSSLLLEYKAVLSDNIVNSPLSAWQITFFGL